MGDGGAAGAVDVDAPSGDGAVRTAQLPVVTPNAASTGTAAATVRYAFSSQNRSVVYCSRTLS